MKRIFEKHVTLYVGGIHASDEEIIIKTLLGSCISVCLFDPISRVGGMNHFMLPHGQTTRESPEATRFGLHAMDRLIAAVMKVGGDRRRLEAKVFGGAHVLGGVIKSAVSVPRQNSAFAREFLHLEGIGVKVWDVGGTAPREVHFHPRTGRALVRRLRSERLHQKIVARERQESTAPPSFGSVTFFETE